MRIRENHTEIEIKKRSVAHTMYCKYLDFFYSPSSKILGKGKIVKGGGKQIRVPRAADLPLTPEFETQSAPVFTVQYRRLHFRRVYSPPPI